MSYRKALLGWSLCLAPVAAAAAAACATANGPEPSNWTGTPAPTGAASTAANQNAAGSSSGTPAGGTGATSGVSASSSGGAPSGSNSGGNGGISSSGSSGGTPAASSSSGVHSGSSSGASSSGSGGVPNTTQSQTTPDIFADAGPYAPPVEAGRGEHNAGQSCIQMGCHIAGQGPQAPDPFTIAGTVFKDYAGTIPYVGAEVRVQDANGQTMTTYTHDNGNFSFGRSVAFPAVVAVRDATTTRQMVTQLTTAAMGSCAMAGCHIVGGSPSTGAYYPIHVP